MVLDIIENWQTFLLFSITQSKFKLWSSWFFWFDNNQQLCNFYRLFSMDIFSFVSLPIIVFVLSIQVWYFTANLFLFWGEYYYSILLMIYHNILVLDNAKFAVYFFFQLYRTYTLLFGVTKYHQNFHENTFTKGILIFQKIICPVILEI